MKKVEILKPFRDKSHFNTAYMPGEVKEFDNDRAAMLVARGLVKELDTDKEEKPEKPKGKGGKGKNAAKGNATSKEADPKTDGDNESETNPAEGDEANDNPDPNSDQEQ